MQLDGCNLCRRKQASTRISLPGSCPASQIPPEGLCVRVSDGKLTDSAKELRRITPLFTHIKIIHRYSAFYLSALAAPLQLLTAGNKEEMNIGVIRYVWSLSRSVGKSPIIAVLFIVVSLHCFCVLQEKFKRRHSLSLIC